MAYVTSRIHCASCGEDLEIVYSAPEPGSLADHFAALMVGIGGAPISPDTTICPLCGGDIGDHSGDADDPDLRKRE
jgi:rRNA maturation protein Nop10